MFYRVIKGLFWPIGKIYFRLSVRGGVPRRGPAVLAANHVSLLDPAVLGSACPRPVRFLVTRRLYDLPSQGWFYRFMRAIPVRADSGEPDHAAVRRALRALREGELVGIFPEGVGLDPEGRLRRAREGAALLAMRAGAPIIPVAIEGTHRALPKGRRWPRPARVTVTFGEPLEFGTAARGESRGARRTRTAEVMGRIEAMLEGRRG